MGTTFHLTTPCWPDGFLERFWSKIEKSEGCWLWKNAKDKNGYGQIVLRGKQLVKAHRVSWIIRNGEIKDGLQVLHNCPCGDNPSCVNPDHLWLGTCLQNNQDRMRKGRFSCGDRINSTGEKSHFAKLEELQVLEIKSLYRSGPCTYKDLSARFGIGVAQVGNIIRGDAWAHLSA